MQKKQHEKEKKANEGEWLMIEISYLGDLEIIEKELGKLSFAQIDASEHVILQICSMTDTDDRHILYYE